MTVGELITELQKHDPSHMVHIDVTASDVDGWEGDRVVRPVEGVRVQEGFKAVAIDAVEYSPEMRFE